MLPESCSGFIMYLKWLHFTISRKKKTLYSSCIINILGITKALLDWQLVWVLIIKKKRKADGANG